MPKVHVAPLDEFGPGLGQARRARVDVDRGLQLRRRAARGRGSLLARRRPSVRGRVGRGDVPRHLPPPRRRVRPPHRPGADAAGHRSRSGRIPSSSRTGSSRSTCRWSEAERRSLLRLGRRPLHRLPRRGVGPAGTRRAQRLRAALPRGLPVRAVLADDPAQARGASGARSPASTPRWSPSSRRTTSSGCSLDDSIVRHRGKIEATITNARATLALREAGPPAARAALDARAAPSGRRRGHTPTGSRPTPQSEELAQGAPPVRLSASSDRPPCMPRCRRAGS